MEFLTLIVAGIAAVASIATAWLSNRHRIQLQAADQRFAETMLLQPRRLELYGSLVSVLRGHDRSVDIKSPSDFGGGDEGHAAATDSFFMDAATDSTQRLGEARTLVGQIRLISSNDAVAAAEGCIERLRKLNNMWMGVLLQYVKDEADRDVKGAMERVSEAQARLGGEVDRFEAIIRAEQGIEKSN